jgi:hypothetical protein
MLVLLSVRDAAKCTGGGWLREALETGEAEA